MSQEAQRPDVPESERLKLVRHGVEIIEAIGESFLSQRFVTMCPVPSRLFSAAKLEGFTREKFPRILLEPGALHGQALTPEHALADLEYLAGLIRKNPEGFTKLVGLLDDPEAFRTEAGRFGLTEGAAQAAGGGWLFLVLVVAAAVVLTGCPGPAAPPPKCPSTDPGTGVRCTKDAGHKYTPFGQTHVSGTATW